MRHTVVLPLGGPLRVVLFLLVGLLMFTDPCLSTDSPFPLREMDSLGREVLIREIPRRIVSTTPTNTEILYDLGLRDRVVGVSNHCHLTCDVRDKTPIGGWASADIQKILDLKPDLVFAFGGLQVPLIDSLERQGITVFSYYPKTVEETLHMLEAAGRITGTGQRAGRLLVEARGKFERIKREVARIPWERRASFLRLISPKGVIVAGRYSFQHDILVQAGGRGIMEGFLRYYGKAEFDKIRDLDPDIIILNGDDEEGVRDAFCRMEGWSDLRAVRQNSIKVMPCRLICHPNFRIVDVVELLWRHFCPGQGD